GGGGAGGHKRAGAGRARGSKVGAGGGSAGTGGRRPPRHNLHGEDAERQEKTLPERGSLRRTSRPVLREVPVVRRSCLRLCWLCCHIPPSRHGGQGQVPLFQPGASPRRRGGGMAPGGTP